MVILGGIIAAAVAALFATTVRAVRQNRKLRAQIQRISATDDELLAVLEATESPLAHRLLSAVKTPGASSEKPRTDEDDFDSRFAVYGQLQFDSYRVALVQEWIRQGLRFTPKQAAKLIRQLQFDSYRVSAMKLLEEARTR